MRERKSIDALSRDELDALVWAWDGIQKLPPDDEKSFFKLAGYHGEPFRGAGWGGSDYWGGYCNHGNVLFPTWHRMYLLKLEEALRSIEGCENVSLPYWNEVSEASVDGGIPSVFTEQKYSFRDSRGEIDNPLYSYTLAKNIVDNRSAIPDANYSKPVGYETVRFPLSGLVGTEKDREETRKHNDKYSPKATYWLNKNVSTWLKAIPIINLEPVGRLGLVRDQYAACLNTKDYTRFSNTTSAKQWNDNASLPVVSLESPHNAIHLAIGGFDLPNIEDDSPIRGANGDMGENETASFDPIFYFHHCFVDLIFWMWQVDHKATNQLEIIQGYPGTNSVDGQGPTPGVVPNSWLDMDSPLDPFKKEDGSPYTSNDCVNIAKLGYEYDLEPVRNVLEPVNAPESVTVIHVSGIDRTKIKGSFLISAFAHDGNEYHNIGTEAVLSRWHVEGCANCQNHLLSSATFTVPERLLDENNQLVKDPYTFKVGITTHTERAVENLRALTHIRDDGVITTDVADETLFHAELRRGGQPRPPAQDGSIP